MKKTKVAFCGAHAKDKTTLGSKAENRNQKTERIKEVKDKKKIDENREERGYKEGVSGLI